MPFNSMNPGGAAAPKTSANPASTYVAASATAVALVAARTNRNKLSFYNNSNGTLYIRYAATGAGTSATASNGGWDDMVPSNTIYEYPGPSLPPESAINGIWVAPSGSTLSGGVTVTEGIS